MKNQRLHIAFFWFACLLAAACKPTEILSDHNLLDGEILTVVHGCSGFVTYRNTLPPNTLAAAERSLLENADAIEMDVQLTADGQLVVFHDGELFEATTCTGCIHDHTWAELQSCTYQTRNGNLDGVHHLPLLDTMFATVQRIDSDALLFLNTKHDSPCDPGSPGFPLFAKTLVDLIRAHEMSDRVIIESMDAGFLDVVHGIAPELKLLFDDEDFERGMAVVRAHHFLGLAISNGRVTEAQARQAHSEGYWLGIWGQKVMDDTRKAIAKGPEFVMTDDLLMLQAALKK
jgi:glycerophosphoryl diester phosphodiesterase